MRGGETDIAEVVSNEMILKESRKISILLKHKGNVDCDILVDSKGLYVIDVNPRFGGGYMFSLASGMDVPYYLHCWDEGISVPENKKGHFKEKCYRKITELKQLSF